jgi:hypothetical protein
VTDIERSILDGAARTDRIANVLAWIVLIAAFVIAAIAVL